MGDALGLPARAWRGLPGWAQAGVGIIDPAVALNGVVADKLAPQTPGAPPAVTAPPSPPDLTDDAVRRARLAASQRAGIGQGMDSTFLTGPLGLQTPTMSRPGSGG